MKTYVITGVASGIGQATAQALTAQGHRVIGIDLHDADVCADLCDAQARNAAVEKVAELAPDGVDGFVPAAGVGPAVKNATLIPRLNYFAVVDLVNRLKVLLSKKSGSVVLLSSNSAPMGSSSEDYVQTLLVGDEQKVIDMAQHLDTHTLYAGGKYALNIWMREYTRSWLQEGVRMNAVAPGVTQTRMTDDVFQDEALGEVMQAFADDVPMGKVALPADIAKPIAFLLSDDSAYCAGSILFIDGGHDAAMRPKPF